MIEITDIRFVGTPQKEFLCYASVVFNNCFVVTGMKLVKRSDDPTPKVFMPSRKMTDGKYKDVAHPITADFRTALVKAVIDKYEEKKAQPESQPEAKVDDSPF